MPSGRRGRDGVAAAEEDGGFLVGKPLEVAVRRRRQPLALLQLWQTEEWVAGQLGQAESLGRSAPGRVRRSQGKPRSSAMSSAANATAATRSRGGWTTGLVSSFSRDASEVASPSSLGLASRPEGA